MLVKQFDFNLAYAKALVIDVPAVLMTHVPAQGFENHPAFTLGHLVSGCAMLVEDLGGKFEMPNEWESLFRRKGPGDERLPDLDKKKYPAKEILIEALEAQHKKVNALLLNLTTADLTKKITWRFSNYFPCLEDYVAFMCLQHEAMHLGQLAAWRRAMGYASALATL